MTKDEALKLALEALKKSHICPLLPDDCSEAITAIKEALMSDTDGAQKEQEPEYKGWYCAQCQRGVDGSEVTYHEQHTVCGRVITDDLPPKTQPVQEPVAWKLVPVEPTKEMLKAMDECSTEGYDERLYAGHAASVYMAAVDVAPTPPQPWEKFCDSNCVWTDHHPDCKLAQRLPLTDEEIILIVAECASSHQHTDIHLARAIEQAHGIKGEA